MNHVKRTARSTAGQSQAHQSDDRRRPGCSHLESPTVSLRTHLRAVWRFSPGLLATLLATALLSQVAAAVGLEDDYPLPPDKEAYLINGAFGDPLPPGPLKYPPVTSLDELTAYIRDMQMPVSMFPNAYENLVVTDHRKESIQSQGYTYNIFTVTYDIAGARYTAHAYYAAADSAEPRGAVLVIPGTGLNQSTAIYISDNTNYQYDIGGWVRKQWDLYVHIKPNEDYLAVHRLGVKLSANYIVSYALNAGGSYSVRYLVDSLAMVKHLQQSYDVVAVVGLSQGGQAALYNALQSEPEGAIVASGYSVLHERLLGANLGQIIIPGHMTYYSNSKVRDILRGSRTRFLFTYGRLETGSYKVEAQAGCTAEFFKGLSNVTCSAFTIFHEFPRAAIMAFLESLTLPPNPPPTARSLSQNHPNPFLSATRIAFSVDKEGPVRLEIFDAEGRQVRKLVEASLRPDTYSEDWDGTDDDGRRLPAGVYFYRLRLRDWTVSRKMTLVR